MGQGATIADTVISSLSLLGGISIIIGYSFSSQKHHIRQKVVLGLGVVDVIQAADTLYVSLLLLSSHS